MRPFLGENTLSSLAESMALAASKWGAWQVLR